MNEETPKTTSVSTPSQDRFSTLAIAFHWIIGLLILTAIALSYYWDELPRGPEKYEIYNLHKSIGILVLLFALPRLAYRLMHGRPPKFDHYKKWEVTLSSVVTWSLYGLMIAMPISGWLMSSGGGYAVPFFGLFEMPALIGKSKELGGIFHETHELCGNVIQILIVLHVGGTLKHYVMDKDNTLYRMLPISIFKK